MAGQQINKITIQKERKTHQRRNGLIHRGAHFLYCLDFFHLLLFVLCFCLFDFSLFLPIETFDVPCVVQRGGTRWGGLANGVAVCICVPLFCLIVILFPRFPHRKQARHPNWLHNGQNETQRFRRENPHHRQVRDTSASPLQTTQASTSHTWTASQLAPPLSYPQHD